MRSTPPVRDTETNAKPNVHDLLIRPSTASDIDDFYQLACLAGAGFTSLPANEALLKKRLTVSEQAFAGEPGILMLALEDKRSNSVVGCAAVKPGGLPRPHFLNFHIDAASETLRPTSRYADMTEVGSLLLHPNYRQFGVGPWLARSRYLLIATDPLRFGEHIFSELRGIVDGDDRSPFYDAVCAPFFGRSFADADDLCARGLQEELNALLPATPIALSDLAPDALASIGEPHCAGRKALDYLIDEGFRFEGVVDLLDGGPAVVAKSREVRTIQTAFSRPLKAGAVDQAIARSAYVAVGTGSNYRCCRASIFIRDDRLVCPPDVIALLNAEEGAIAHICLIDQGNGPHAEKDRERPAISRRKVLDRMPV